WKDLQKLKKEYQQLELKIYVPEKIQTKDESLADLFNNLNQLVNSEETQISKKIEEIKSINTKMDKQIEKAQENLSICKEKLKETKACKTSVDKTLKEQSLAAKRFASNNVILSETSKETLLENYFNLSPIL